MAKQKEKDETKEVNVLPFDTSDKVPENYVPEGYNSQEEFLEDMRKEYQLDVDFDRENRKEALDD